MSNTKTTTVKFFVLNNKGDEELDLMLAQAMDLLNEKVGDQRMWAFDKDNNQLTTRDEFETALAQDDQEITVMPSSVGGCF